MLNNLKLIAILLTLCILGGYIAILRADNIRLSAKLQSLTADLIIQQTLMSAANADREAQIIKIKEIEAQSTINSAKLNSEIDQLKKVKLSDCKSAKEWMINQVYS